jgi:DNA-binding NarL/FixJ family response regulator
MDLRMPEMDGVAATREIAERSAARVVVLTTYADDESIFPALRAGAVGYLTKDASAEEIEAAIRAVHRGQTWLDPPHFPKYRVTARAQAIFMESRVLNSVRRERTRDSSGDPKQQFRTGATLHFTAVAANP